MYINAQKPKIMVVSRQDNISVQVDHEGESLEQVHDFKFLGSYKSADADCTKEIKRRIALTRQKAVVLASILKDKNIKTATKVKVMKSMVWALFQYGVEGWTLKKSDRNGIKALEMWCHRKMLSISWQEHRTNDSILTELGLKRELIERVAKLKLQYFSHITWGNAGQLALTVLEGIMEELQHQGRPRRQWIHDIEEWTGCKYIQLKEMSQNRAQWRRKTSPICCRQPSSRKAD